MPVRAIPGGFHSMTPYLVIQGAAKIIEDVAPDQLRRRAEKHMGGSH